MMRCHWITVNVIYLIHLLARIFALGVSGVLCVTKVDICSSFFGRAGLFQYISLFFRAA
jgi:hypothetical protein